jgi:hypothetical protein
MGGRFSTAGSDGGGQAQYLFLAQRFARHISPLTTTIYTHASEGDVPEGAGAELLISASL